MKCRETSDMSKLNEQTIYNKEFNIEFKGYSTLEVDTFLDLVIQDYQYFNFEIQIRTITQDSWSVLDHKIKYKKSIPSSLKRRINTLAALF